jgi:DHA1 family inner membrane transport protein
VTGLSPARVRFALLALALGGFGIGTTEFVAMGLLDNLARDLLPTLYSASHEDAIAQTGWLITAYALGVVVGAPTIAALSARFPRKQLLLWLLVAFTLATVLSAVLPTFELVLAARFVAGLPHGAYFGIATLVAASLMGEGKRGRGVAFVLSGLTIANVIGVPLITLLGQQAGWRVAYLAVASIFALTFVAVAVSVPLQAGDKSATLKRELRAFGRPQVWLSLLTGAIGFGGFFAVYSYVSPVVTQVTGQSESFVPVALVVIGLGMTLGNLVGGRAADHHVMGTIFVCFGIFVLALASFALTAQWTPGLLVSLFLVGGAAAALSPAVQSRLMDVAGDSQTLAAAANHAALNIGNSLGAYLGGLTIAAGLGYLSPAVVGLLLCVPGIGLALWSVAQREVGLEGSRLVGLDEDAVFDRSLAQGDLRADVEARDAVLLADALEVRLRRLFADAELEGHGLHRLAAAVEGHDAALLGAELGRAADLACVEGQVELGGDERLADRRGAQRLDDHAGVFALDEVAERSGSEGLAHHVGLGVGAHQHDLHGHGLERRDFQRDGDVVFEVEVEQYDVDGEGGARQQFGPARDGGDHLDVLRTADPLGEGSQQHPVIVSDGDADALFWVSHGESLSVVRS